MNRHIGKVAVDCNRHKRRYRQIGRLIYYYCCVKHMVRDTVAGLGWMSYDDFLQKVFRGER